MTKRLLMASALFLQFLVFADPAAGSSPLRIALTFDDSLKDHLLIAAPMLEERGWRGTFNIVTDWVGKSPRYLTWDDVRELVRRGHEIATHTKTHANMVKLIETDGEDALRRELLESVDKIQSETGIAPRFVCTPYTKQNEETERVCRSVGLRQFSAPRHNFGSNNCDRVALTVDKLIRSGETRADILHHGVSQADHGGWCSFPDRESFRRHLDAIAELERQGKVIVTDYDGMASDCRLRADGWPRHGVVSLSFDDANFDQWEAALPLFRKYDASVSFCVVGTNRLDFLRLAQSNGHEIASHGLRHADVPPAVDRMGADGYWESEMKPQLDVFRAAGVFVRSFAYPNCVRTAETDEMFFRRGISRVRGSEKGHPSPNPYDPKGEKLALWRPIAQTDSMFIPAADFISARFVRNVIIGEAYHTDIEDVMRAVDRAGARGEALFLVSHGICPNARGISMKTEWLERILASAAQSGVLVRGLR